MKRICAAPGVCCFPCLTLLSCIRIVKSGIELCMHCFTLHTQHGNTEAIARDSCMRDAGGQSGQSCAKDSADRFEGEITAVAPGHALVRYNDLMDGSDDSSKLQEWFPEASLASAAASADFPGPHVRHTLPGFRMRPIPDPEVSIMHVTFGCSPELPDFSIRFFAPMCSLATPHLAVTYVTISGADDSSRHVIAGYMTSAARHSS